MKKFFKIIFLLGIFGLLAGSLVGFILYKKYSNDLPDYEQLKSYKPYFTTRLYAADGSLMNEFAKENRVFVPIENIPDHLIKAFLAAEDADFYYHQGIDLLAIVRTTYKNAVSLAKGEQIVGGASTITQQVVKNLLLNNERTIERKIKEAILAYRMSKTFSKNQVLELYLNQIYLGSGAYGVAVAAETYFNKPIDQLTIEEDALLATLPKAPSKLDPRKNITKSKIRRDWVINRMIEEDFITETEGKEAIAKPIILKDKEDRNFSEANFFSDAVKKVLTDLYGSDHVFEDGIVVRTTLDPRLQDIARRVLAKGIEAYDQKHGYRGHLGNIPVGKNWLENLNNFEIDQIYKDSWDKAVVLSLSSESVKIGVNDGKTGFIELNDFKWARKYKDIDVLGGPITKSQDLFKVGDVIMVEKTNKKSAYALKQIPNVNGALIAIDPHNGKILAMMGGYLDAPNQFNRATQAFRQPGSTLKTFGYIAALENGMNPASIIMDEEVALDQGAELPPYKPTNYSGKFYGPTTLRQGLENSLNVTTVRMANEAGLDNVADVVKRFGVNDNPESIYSLVLGSTETNLIRVTTAYAMMVNGGNKIIPSMIEKIQDHHGNTIYRRDNRVCYGCMVQDQTQITNIPELEEYRQRVTDSATAYQITSMLQGVVQRGTGVGARAIGKIVAGKTGTTNNSFDSWFVGFSPDLVTGVYVGYDMPRSLGKHETGASIALPIFVDFMEEALANTPSTPFRVPETIKFVKIDRQTGKKPTALTPKNEIFLEALKLDDSLEDIHDIEGNEYNDYRSDPVGIY